jgi:hypothetical protein
LGPHRSAVVGRIFLQQENWRRSIWDWQQYRHEAGVPLRAAYDRSAMNSGLNAEQHSMPNAASAMGFSFMHFPRSAVISRPCERNRSLPISDEGSGAWLGTAPLQEQASVICF